jgi:hypothetical protein
LPTFDRSVATAIAPFDELRERSALLTAPRESALV